jgi:predicted esterase
VPRRAVFLLALAASCRAPENKSVAPAVSAAAPPVVVDASSIDVSSAAAVEWPDVETDWCLPPFRGLDESNCYFQPEEKKLLIYLSGIVPPQPKVSPQKENVQRIVSSAAKKAGAAVLLPRGRRGIGPTDAKDWWAWPTSASDYNVHAKQIVLEWKSARTKLETLRKKKFDRVYLAGSSSGAYFLSALALAGALEEDIDGYAATSGGAPSMLGANGVNAGAPKRPFYVGYATGDPTNGGPKSLASFLTSKGWPVQSKEHAGGHGAKEEYLNDAFKFWSETTTTQSN